MPLTMTMASQYKPVEMNKDVTALVVDSKAWTDTYFEGEPDVLAVFDVDYLQLQSDLSRTKWLAVLFFGFQGIGFMALCLFSDTDRFGANFFLVFVTLLLLSLIVFPSVRAFNEQMKRVYGLHVAVARPGIRRDANSYPTGACFHTTTMMPFDEIQKVDLHRGGVFQPSSTVFIYSKEDSSVCAIYCLKDPEAFVELVETMMSQQSPTTETSLLAQM